MGNISKALRESAARKKDPAGFDSEAARAIAASPVVGEPFRKDNTIYVIKTDAQVRGKEGLKRENCCQEQVFEKNACWPGVVVALLPPLVCGSEALRKVLSLG